MFTKNDLNMLKGLNHLLDEGTFPVKRREVGALVQVLTWVKQLENRIQEDLKSEKSKPKNNKVDKK